MIHTQVKKITTDKQSTVKCKCSASVRCAERVAESNWGGSMTSRITGVSSVPIHDELDHAPKALC